MRLLFNLNIGTYCSYVVIGPNSGGGSDRRCDVGSLMLPLVLSGWLDRTVGVLWEIFIWIFLKCQNRKILKMGKVPAQAEWREMAGFSRF